MNAAFVPVSRRPLPADVGALGPDTGGSPRPEGRPVTKPVIIYDDVGAGESALQAVASLMPLSLGPSGSPPAFWSFKMMEHPARRISASADALNSDLLILTTQGEASLPAGLVRWLRECIPQKRGSATTVVALFGPPGHYDGPDSPRLQFVRQVVEGAGLIFVAPTTDHGGGFPTVTANLHDREEAITPTLERILHRGDFPAH